ncbi:hypothetical protein [Spirosoma panaciterrae]|uniref:hypothetical protein n=1 Tax=Spirosoma panaciterrae TaxID=496058 RepID=UPI00037CD4CE|nr:hypothetical protein [Spirosoma panaciterrae]
MNTWRFFLLCLCFSSDIPTLRADIIPAGQRRVDACFRLANVDQYPNYVFLAYIQQRFGDTYTLLNSDRCIGLGKQSSASIYAIAKEKFKEEAIRLEGTFDSEKSRQQLRTYFNENPNLMRADLTVYPHDFIPESDSALAVEDVLVIKSLTSDTLILGYDSAIFAYASGRKDKRIWDEIGVANAGSEQAFLGDSRLWLTVGGIALLMLVAILYARNRKR